MDSAADETSQKAFVTNPTATHHHLDRAVESRHHSFDSPLTNSAIATERQHPSHSSSIKPQSDKLFASINTTDAETLENQTRDTQSWNNRSSSRKQLERGRDFHWLSLRTKRESTQGNRPDTNDRDHLPSQSQPSPTASLSHNRPMARMVYVHQRKRHSLGDDTPRRPLTPSARAEDSHSESALSSGDITNHNGFVGCKGFNNDLSELTDESVETTTPIFRRHRRNQKAVWQMEDPVLQYEPLKRSSYDERYSRAKSEQHVDKPVNPDNKWVHPSDLGNTGFIAPSGAWNVPDPETFLSRQKVSPITKRLQRPLRHVEQMNHMEDPGFNTRFLPRLDLGLMLLAMDDEEARGKYPLDSFTLGGIEDGCNVVDWACPWPSDKACKRLTRFPSRSDSAPSVHYRPDCERPADSNASPGGNVDKSDRRSEHGRNSLHTVNVPNEARHDGLATLAPLTHNPTGEKTMTLLRNTYNPDTGEEATTLLPLTYHASIKEQTAHLLASTHCAATYEELKSALPINRKSVPRDSEIVSSRSSAPITKSQDKVHMNSEDNVIDGGEDGDLCAKSRAIVSPSKVTRSSRHSSPHDPGADFDQISVEKRYSCGGLTELRNRSSQPVDKSVASLSDAEKQITAHTITRRPLPANFGVWNQDFQSFTPDQNQRGVSMPVFSHSSTAWSGNRKHTRHSSFGKLFSKFGKRDKTSGEAKVGGEPKKSLGRRISQRVGKTFSSLWSK